MPRFNQSLELGNEEIEPSPSHEGAFDINFPFCVTYIVYEGSVERILIVGLTLTNRLERSYYGLKG